MPTAQKKNGSPLSGAGRSCFFGTGCERVHVARCAAPARPLAWHGCTRSHDIVVNGSILPYKVRLCVSYIGIPPNAKRSKTAIKRAKQNAPIIPGARSHKKAPTAGTVGACIYLLINSASIAIGNTSKHKNHIITPPLFYNCVCDRLGKHCHE